MTIVKLPRRVPEKKTFSLASIICAAALPAAWAQSLPAPALPEKEPDAPVQLTVFEVREDADVGYRATQTLSGSRTAQQLRDIPSSISVQNRALIEDLMVTDIAELSMYNISGEVDVNNESPISSGPSGGTVSRGTSTTNLRDGVVFFVSQDSHNVDRVELLRGPNGFLYTGGGAGGISNPVPKQAMRKKSQSAALIMGSNNLFRAEYDINRPINEQLAFRASLAFQEGGGFQNHTERSFRGLYATLNYRPFASTNINVSADVGRNIAVMAPNMLSDQFSTTDRTGSTVAYSATTGGFTYVPARGLMFDSVGTRRSQGTNLILFDGSIVSDKVNMPGPGATNQTEHYAHTLAIDQKVGERLNIQFKGTLQGGIRDIGIKGGSQDASVYRDMSATLPNGQPNPYFGEYYTEFWHGTRHYPEPMRSVRLSVVYDIKTRWMTQRLIGGLHYQSQEPLNEQWAEFVDPASPYFKGSLINANTLEAYRSNRTVLSQNRVNRRFYFRDGDAEHITKRGPIPGQTVMLRDIVTDGADGRTQDRLYWNEGGMIGASGSYFKGRVHTMVGWRQDAFIQDPGKDFYNSVTGEHFRLGETGRLHHRARPESYNYGGVIHIAKFLAAYATYAENVVLTTTAGQPGLLPGTIRAAPKGYGDEYGLRWLFFGDRLESNWTYYKTYRKASASIPANVRSTELGLMVDGLNTDGSDSQDVLAEGFEFETIANLTSNWRLLWNLSTNDLATANRYPDTKKAKEIANQAGFATPVTDAFLASVPDGTPTAGFTRMRSNLVTSYRFESGPLKNFSIGCGVQYRKESYQGNYDRDRDGTAEMLWTPGYTVANLMTSYRTRLWDRAVTIGLNINNLLDKRYYRARSLETGAVGLPREFRFSVRGAW